MYDCPTIFMYSTTAAKRKRRKKFVFFFLEKRKRKASDGPLVPTEFTRKRTLDSVTPSMSALMRFRRKSRARPLASKILSTFWANFSFSRLEVSCRRVRGISKFWVVKSKRLLYACNNKGRGRKVSHKKGSRKKKEKKKENPYAHGQDKLFFKGKSELEFSRAP